MSVILSSALTDFLIHQSIKNSTSLQFSSGSLFEGSIKDNQAYGYGKFIWSNNETYEGFFDNGIRVKIGKQTWDDGDEYIGEFFKDKRHGWGIYKWWNNDTYEGSFYEDMRHGFGIYKCNNGNIYDGTFYRNKREGFGTLRYTSGDVFQGLYKEDYRCGPGIYLYQNGCQDIGLWHRGSLLKLIINMEEVFQLSQFSDLMNLYPNNNSDVFLNTTVAKALEPNEAEYSLDYILQYKLTKPESIAIFAKENDDNLSVKDNEKTKTNAESDIQKKDTLENEELDQKNLDENNFLMKHINKRPITIELIDSEESSDPHEIEDRRTPLSVDDSFHEFLSNIPSTDSMTPLMLKILNHLKRFSKNIPMKSEENIGKDFYSVVKDVVTNTFNNSLSNVKIDRNKNYAPPGDIETKSYAVITSSHVGSVEAIWKLFSDRSGPNPNVTDGRGSFSLLEASLTWNTEIVNQLLDWGADINQLTDEGVSALGSCFLFYYPQKSFIDTIAESVVNLSYTPLNFNGIRREPLKHPIMQTELLDNFNESSDINTSENNELQQDTNEQWDDYQKSVLPVKVLQNSTQIPKNQNNLMTFNKHKIEDDKSCFDSHRNIIEYPTKVGQELIEKAASALSNNSLIMQRQPRPNSRNQDLSKKEGTARFKALEISRHKQMLQIILLLLNRGADPNKSRIPFPAIFFSVKCSDVEMMKVLIGKGADVNARLGKANGSLTPLHISSCLLGKRAIIITELLLKNGADPNGRASEDESFLDKTLINEWSKDIITDEQKALLGGRTPFHLACSRYDDFKVSYQIVLLLLQYGGNPNLICNGHTPLTLAIASGNDLIVEKILAHDKLNVNLPLTHGLGNTICVASSISFEHTRTIEARISLIKKVIASGADLLNPVAIGFKRSLGSAVDYGYNEFYLDPRISRLPYHALTSVERDLFNNRKNILSYMGMFTRECAVEKEKLRLKSMKIEGIESRGPSPDFVWTGAGADPEDQRPISKALSKISHNLISLDLQMQGSDLLARKPLFKYCYECGRSVNVKLTGCTRCKEVFFCSKLCKTKAWNARHKFECLRVGGRVSTAGSERNGNRNIDSPTPATIMEEAALAMTNNKMMKSNVIKPKKKEENDLADSELKVNSLPRKLPPLDSKTHPSYSYTYVMDNYVKANQLDKVIIINSNCVDNYSFE